MITVRRRISLSFALKRNTNHNTIVSLLYASIIIIIITIRGFIVRLLQFIGALQSHPYCQQTQKAKLKKCALSRFYRAAWTADAV